MFHTLLALLSIYCQTAYSATCCPFYCNKADCESATEGCKWLESPTDDSYIVDGIQCRAQYWCPDCPPPVEPVTCTESIPCSTPPPTTTTTAHVTPAPTTTTTTAPVTPTTTTTTTTTAPVTPTPVTPAPVTPAPVTSAPTPNPVTPAPTSISVAGTPGDVGEEIDSAKGECNGIRSRNCWEDPGEDGANWDYSPNQVSFNGVEWNIYKDACCYSYSSVHTDNENCEGDTPGQSHLVFDIDCDEGDFELVDNPEYTSYGKDGSTCYTGIILDTGCEDSCDYDICISYNNLESEDCPVVEGWVMDKAGSAFSFNSLYGIPSCNAVDVKAALNVVIKDGIAQSMRYSPVQMGVMIMIVIVLCGAWLFFNGYRNGEYTVLKDAPHVEEVNRYV